MSVTKNSSKHSTRASCAMRFGDLFERRLALAQRLELRVHVVHEAVEMATALLREGQAVEEQVHEPGLAAADAAPEIEAAFGLCRTLGEPSA